MRQQKNALAQMKEQTDLTICIYHGGFECDLESGETLSQTTENVGYRICKELDFDILLTGHQHMSVPGRDISGTYTVQPCDNAKEYQYLEVTMTDHEKSIRSELRQSDAAKGTVLADKYRSTENAVQAWLNQPIGHLSRAIMPEEKVKMALYGSPIADFLNRIQLHFSGAMLSSVGLANEIAGFRSEVSTRDIIATYPYPNTLVVCEITGKQLKTVMERSAEYFAYDKDGNVCVSDSFLIPKVEHYNYDYYMGVDFKINPENPIGSRIEGLSKDGKPGYLMMINLRSVSTITVTAVPVDMMFTRSARWSKRSMLRWWNSLWIISTNIRILRCDVSHNGLDRMPGLKYN